MKVTIQVWTDLYEAGKTEDGQPYTAEVFLIRATMADGSRFTYRKSWAGCQVENIDGMNFFTDVRDQACADAEAELAQLQDQTLRDDDWQQIEPEYGSVAYLRDEFERVDRERRQA